VVGTGRIGQVVIEILRGFGCEVLAYDVVRNAAVEKSGAKYVGLEVSVCGQNRPVICG